MKKVLILSAVDPTRAYSCIKYLYESLKKKYDCKLCCASLKNDAELKSWDSNIHNFFGYALGRLSKVRMFQMKIMGYVFAFNYRNNVIICHDLFHYKAANFVKMIFPKTTLVLYFTEIYNEKNVWWQKKIQKSFDKSKKRIDYVIECDYFRMLYRKEKYSIRHIDYIYNTLPKAEIRQVIKTDNVNKSEYRIIYAGAASSKVVDIIIEAVKSVKYNYIFELCCYGDSREIELLKEKCTRVKMNFLIHSNLDRNTVFKYMDKADIGIAYYDPTYSINTLYAAPTKFFEYLGHGLAIVSSKNISLEMLIKKYSLGEVMDTNDAKAMTNAINKVIENIDFYKNNVKDAYNNYLCYEIQSKLALSKLGKLIEGKNEKST